MNFFNRQNNMSTEDVNTIASELANISKLLDRLIDENRDIRRDINGVKTRIDTKAQEEFNTLERKYITMLEGKLIQFDEEARKLKSEKDEQYMRLNAYFYNGNRP